MNEASEELLYWIMVIHVLPYAATIYDSHSPISLGSLIFKSTDSKHHTKRSLHTLPHLPSRTASHYTTLPLWVRPPQTGTTYSLLAFSGYNIQVSVRGQHQVRGIK